MEVHNPVDLIIINDKNQVLLARRSDDDPEYKGSWSIPGGGPFKGENFEEALVREIREELGCSIKWSKFFKSYCIGYPNDVIVRSVYFYGEISGRIRLNSELSEYRWFDIKGPDLRKLHYAFNQKDVMKDFIAFYSRRKPLR